MVATTPDPVGPEHRGNRVSLRTLVVLRWIAVLGQITALVSAEVGLGMALPRGACALIVGAAVVVNLTATVVFPSRRRLTENQVTLMLLFDMAQLLALVAVTGGLNNPFALLVLAPVTISATALPRRQVILVSATAIAGTSALIWLHLPLIRGGGQVLELSDLFEAGFWTAIVTGVIFVASYAHRVSQEIHTMAQALLATQMALARAQKLTDLGGVVAAAAHELGTPLATIKLISAEMLADLGGQPALAEDARLIREQADRCRDILRTMGQAGAGDGYLARAPLEAVVREAAEPHLDRGKTVHFALPEGRARDQPLIERRPEIIHGLRNLIQNAVDFAGAEVWLDMDWTGGAVRLRIGDDGPGFPNGLLGRLGDPFVRRRDTGDPLRPEYEGMGLGLFIAKTLLERTGAEIDFLNDPDGGALVIVDWPAKVGLVDTGENAPIAP